MTILNPPICLEVIFTNVISGTETNQYNTTLVSTGGQGYSGGVYFYDCTSLEVGMWASNSNNGYAFKIYNILNTDYEIYKSYNTQGRSLYLGLNYYLN